jgi:hypothetical protein
MFYKILKKIIIKYFAARASGALLAVGFGGYVTHRVCTRLLGADWLTSVLASLQCAFARALDPRADDRLCWRCYRRAASVNGSVRSVGGVSCVMKHQQTYACSPNVITVVALPTKRLIHAMTIKVSSYSPTMSVRQMNVTKVMRRRMSDVRKHARPSCLAAVCR